MGYVSRAEESKAYPILVQPSGGSSGRQTAHTQKKEIFSQQPVVRKQTKWSPEENAVIIELRGHGMKWDDISKREWDDDRKNKLARLYDRYDRSLRQRIAIFPVSI
ncbi:MYB DNA-binding domain protein [Akanthomyces lecanii RCEF 1005]|uniref:MYB DNA-binding domain protein n=1 Tax=Akanthomyces lecanii RCEF 1005 TaxID=1081108 RepID=A0A167TS52_CORDF|nr:MYB DNA-binding domain protein [Akanthomyces lecanii RCEF 1005]